MERGWVYVLVNSSMPNMAKVGRTTRQPAERVAELSAATGVATPFVLAFEREFADCIQAEQDIHAELDRMGRRVAANREFFRGPTADIVHIVLNVADCTCMERPSEPAASAADLVAQADQCLWGHDDAFQDPAEALRIYRLAASRGSVVALERLGGVHGVMSQKSPAGRRRALKYLKEVTARGNYYCYVEMAGIYQRDDHAGNFVKAWAKFFRERAARQCDDVEAGECRYLKALRRYVVGCIDMELEPAHLAELEAVADTLMTFLVIVIGKLEDPDERACVAGALRWIYERVPGARPEWERQKQRELLAPWIRGRQPA
jgi:hypothetical protein